MIVLGVAVAGVLAAVVAFARPRRLADVGGAVQTHHDPDRRPVHPGNLVEVTMSVVIPARDEEASLPILLASLQTSTAAPLEIVVVDDSSSDATADVARRAGAQVITAGPPPHGWAGKPWACATGAAHTTGTMLVFLDADTRLGPDALGLLRSAVQRHGGLCSVQPYHDVPRLYEQLSALFNASAVLGSGQFGPAAPTGPSRRAVAYGPCMATSRIDYDAAGGHGVVRGSVIEDLELAQAYARCGLASTCWLGGDEVRFRMYPAGVRTLVEGWTKNIALGARAAAPVAVATTIVWIAALAWVVSATAVGSVRWSLGHGPPLAAYASWTLVAVHLHWLLRRLGSFRPITAAAVVVPLLFFLGVFLRSAVLVALRRPVRWRGRSVTTRRVEQA